TILFYFLFLMFFICFFFFFFFQAEDGIRDKLVTGVQTCALPILVIAVVEGQRYLVSMLGENVSWVQNVRAAGGRAVRRSGARERVQLEDVPFGQRAPLLKTYLLRAPGARPHIPVNKDAPLAEFEKIAASFPVFRVATPPMSK